jgi:hypothetical protein
MNISDAKDLIELLAGRSAAWNALWTLFYTVGAAIVGVIASGKLISNRRSLASLIAVIGFLVFAVGNFKALDAMRKQREAVVDFVEVKAQQTNSPEIIAVAKASKPPSFFELCVYHWTLSAAVVAVLVFIPRFLGASKDA